jgi:hypothetical protein
MEIIAKKDNIIEESISKEYATYSKEEKKELHRKYQETYVQNPAKFNQMVKKLETVIFKQIPASPEEFLDYHNGWVPKKDIWPHIKEDFINILNNRTNYFELSFYGSTRQGKTFLAILLIMYTIHFVHCLRDPGTYYRLSSGTKLVIYLVSFKFDKIKELYLDPLYEYLTHADRYIRKIQHHYVEAEQKEVGLEKIVWSSAGQGGTVLTLASGLQIRVGNQNPDEIIGANVIQVYISEIAFFINQPGASEERIFELYTNAYSRIRATVGKNYLAWIFLDSSANFSESRIERHIIKTLQYRENVYFRWRSQWEARPWDFPKYYEGVNKLKQQGFNEENLKQELLKQGYVFNVITGNGNVPAAIVTNPLQLKDVPKDLIDFVPIDVYNEYDQNPIKSIKDIGGKPTSNESKFIQNVAIIDSIFNNPHLKNIEGGLVADAADFPEDLLWKQVEQVFFHKMFNGRNQIYRAPTEPRFIGIDVATSAKGDIYGFAMGHMEHSKLLRERMFIYDFCFVIQPGKEGINLSAVEHFILDLMEKGNVSIIDLASDTFQSTQTIQTIKRMNINVSKPHLDTSLEPYIRMLTSLVTGTVKAGKNIFLKNNLRCLERVRPDNGKEKIDHPKGPTVNKYFGDWNNSEAGKNAKDCSDAACSALYSAMESQIMPTVIYEDENKRQSIKTNDVVYQEGIDEAFSKITGEFWKI